MKRIIVLALLALGFAFMAFAEDVTPTAAAATPAATPEGWQKPVVTSGLNLSQNGFNNWVGGGENSFAWQVAADASAVYLGTVKLTNTLKIKYGQLTTDTAGTRKSDDEVKFESMAEYDAGIVVNPYAAFMLQTQIMPGYDYTSGTVEVSKCMNPGYMKESIGGSYSLGDMLTARLGAAIKHTITTEDIYSLKYNMDPEQRVKTELGADVNVVFSCKLMDNLLFKSVADVFSNLQSLDAIDVKIDNTLTAKINDYVNVNFNLVILYDIDLSKAVQEKETLSLGLTYNFL